MLTDTTTHADVEAHCRHLMAARARLPLTWETRAEHEALDAMIEVALDQWLEATS